MPTAVDLARSFKANGWRVVVCDPFGWHLARTSRCVDTTLRVPAPAHSPDAFLEALLSAVAEWDVTLVVPVSEETMHVAALRDRLPKHVTVFGGPQSDTLRLHSKRRFAHIADDIGLAAPQTVPIGSDAATSLLAAHDCVAKPEFSCSGRGVQFLARGSNVPVALPDGYVLQRKIEGDEFSAMAIARHGAITDCVVYRALITSGSVAVAFERVEMPDIERWVRQFVEATAHNGFIAFDFIVDATATAYAIECNPRATSGLHFFNTHRLATAITDGTSAGLRPEHKLQEFWSAWTHWCGSVGDRPARRAAGQAIRSARDVSWRRDDPWVFLLATFSTWPIIWRAMRHGQSFSQVLPRDIEWRVDDDQR
ncbi:MAG: ATP-grasp domain-containing protein [Pseudomonadota bacterium]